MTLSPAYTTQANSVFCGTNAGEPVRNLFIGKIYTKLYIYKFKVEEKIETVKYNIINQHEYIAAKQSKEED